MSQALPTPVESRPRPPRVQARVSDRLQGLLFILPALIVLGICVIYPAYYTIRLALYDGDFFFRFSCSSYLTTVTTVVLAYLSLWCGYFASFYQAIRP